MTKAPVRFEADELMEAYASDPRKQAIYLVLADHVNARLADYFKDAVEVTSFKEAGYFSSWRLTPKPTDTHRALLIGIEKIEKGVDRNTLLNALEMGMNIAERFNLEREFDRLRTVKDTFMREGLK